MDGRFNGPVFHDGFRFFFTGFGCSFGVTVPGDGDCAGEVDGFEALVGAVEFSIQVRFAGFPLGAGASAST